MGRVLIKKKYAYIFKKLNSSSLVCAFSNRELDLGFNNLTRALIKRNRNEFLSSLSVSYKNLVCMQQMHGNKVFRVKQKDIGKGSLNFKDALFNCDALITNEKNIPLGVLTADCLPIFLYDKKNSSIGIVHAGWKSTYEDIIKKVLAAMKEEFNSQAKDLIVCFGPAIRACCYEVGAEFKKYFLRYVKERNEKLYFDLVGANKDSLLKLGVRKGNILDSRICTSCRNEDFFSYRKEGKSVGRMISVIMLR